MYSKFFTYSMDTLQIVRSSLGEIKADIVLKNCKIINVFTKEIIHGHIVIKDNMIVYVGKDIEDHINSSTIIKEIDNNYVCPGLIESHIHIESSMLTLSEFVKAVIPRGTTSVVIDPHELVNVTGKAGLELLIKEARQSPIRFFIELPSCVPSLPGFETSGAILDARETEELLKHKEIFALAEMMNYPGVLYGDSEVIKKIEAAKEQNKLIEGHAPLLSGKELQAYIAAGITSDHEASSWEEALEKVRLGMKIQIRDGSLAKDMETILTGLLSSQIDTRNMIIATDDRNPIDLKEKGHLDHTYRKMIKLGMNPLEALQMLTINAATHLGLHNKIGSIGPGKSADLVIVETLEQFRVLMVISQGRILYENEELHLEEENIQYPSFLLNSISNMEIPKMDDLIIKVNNENKIRANVIEIQDRSLITNKIIEYLEIKDGVVQPNIEADILPIVVVNRHTSEKKIGKGFVKGFGLKNAALASTVAHDSHQLICVGTTYELIMDAIKEIKRIKGGLVAIKPGEKVSVPLEYGGIMSIKPFNEVVEQLKNLHSKINSLECRVSEPFMGLAFLALPVIPHLKITDHGVIDVDNFTIINPLLEE